MEATEHQTVARVISASGPAWPSLYLPFLNELIHPLFRDFILIIEPAAQHFIKQPFIVWVVYPFAIAMQTLHFSDICKPDFVLDIRQSINFVDAICVAESKIFPL